MLRGYRLLIIAACGLTVLIALGTGAYFGSLYASDHKQYQAVTGYQRAQQDYDGPSQSLPDIAGIPRIVERAIANPPPQSGQDHEIRDLAAQEAMAVWAFWMLCAAVGTVVVTIFGTILIFQQVKLTREAVEDTSNATDAMKKANEIAATANRPYLIVQPEVKKATIYDPAQKVIFVYRNYGTSPARLVRHFFALVEKADSAAIEQEFSAMFPGKSFPDGMVVGTGESSSEFFADAENIVIGGPALDINFLEQSYSVWKDAYFFGSVIYADIGGNHWCRRFCWTIENNSVDLQETDPARNSEYRSDKDGNPI